MEIKEKIRQFTSKIDKKVFVFLVMLMLVSGLVRAYKFKEFLLVRADQIRDAEVAKEVLEKGFGQLTLLGPKITTVKLGEGEGGDNSTLHMGPYYYYVQAFAMKIFGTPELYTTAIPDFILSLLAIPLFYLILSNFFSKKTSLITTFLFSFSYLAVQYSRFAWNPNQLIFWQIALIYCLLKFAEVKKKTEAGWWLIGGFVVLLIISQLHFLAVTATALIFPAFFIFQKGWKKIKSKHYFIALIILLFFYSPMILSDIKNNGDNFKVFLAAITQKTSEKSFVSSISENIEKSSLFYLYSVMPISDDELKSVEIFGFIFLISSLGMVFLVLTNKCEFIEPIRSKKNKNLALLLLLYFIFFFFATMNIADRLEKPRYWLSIVPISFLFLAFWLELINKINKKYFSTILIIAISFFVFFENIYTIYSWYSSLSEGTKKVLPLKDPIFRPYRELVTFGQIERVTDYMAQEAITHKKNICYYNTDQQTNSVYRYIIDYKFPNILVKKIDGPIESSKDCVMFVISKKGERWENDVREAFMADRFTYKKVLEDRALVLWEVKVKTGKEMPGRGKEIFEEEDEADDAETETWEEFFEK